MFVKFSHLHAMMRGGSETSQGASKRNVAAGPMSQSLFADAHFSDVFAGESQKDERLSSPSRETSLPTWPPTGHHDILTSAATVGISASQIQCFLHGYFGVCVFFQSGSLMRSNIISAFFV
jgi:hypothetical protein